MSKVFLIAEIAQAHDGDLETAHAYIDALAGTGVDAIKFQTHIAKAESSVHEPFRIKFSDRDATRYDYWKRMEFKVEEWKSLKSHCDQLGLEFMSSPFSNTAVDLLEEIDVKRYKVGSGEVTNLLLLERLAQTGKPVILSSGMSSYGELDRAVNFLKERNVPCAVLQCTTSYPTSPEDFGLNVIGELKARYGIPVGFSDHSARIETGIAAVALGAEVLEFHAVFDRNSKGPDASSSLEIDEIKTLVEMVRNISLALDHPVNKNDIERYSELKSIFEKSLAVNKNLPSGHKLSFEDLEAKKPAAYGIPASLFKQVLGKTLKRDMDQWDFIKETDL